MPGQHFAFFKIRAVYTGIKKLEFFSHSGFLLEVTRQLPLNTAKNPNKKTHLRSVFFFKLRRLFTVFLPIVNARSPLTGIIRVFGHVGRDLLLNHPRRTAHYVRSKVERSRACTPLTKKPVWDSSAVVEDRLLCRHVRSNVFPTVTIVDKTMVRK